MTEVPVGEEVHPKYQPLHGLLFLCHVSWVQDMPAGDSLLQCCSGNDARVPFCGFVN